MAQLFGQNHLLIENSATENTYAIHLPLSLSLLNSFQIFAFNCWFSRSGGGCLVNLVEDDLLNVINALLCVSLWLNRHFFAHRLFFALLPAYDICGSFIQTLSIVFGLLMTTSNVVCWLQNQCSRDYCRMAFSNLVVMVEFTTIRQFRTKRKSHTHLNKISPLQHCGPLSTRQQQELFYTHCK